MKHLHVICGALGIGLTGVAAANAADFTADFTLNWRATGVVHALEGNHVLWQGNLGGLARPAGGTTGPLGRPVIWMCPLQSDVGAATTGFCIGSDSEGDKVFMRSSGDTRPMAEADPGAIAADAGTFTLFAGTGKFAGITGELTFRANSYGFLPDGGFVGYTAVTGAYSLTD